MSSKRHHYQQPQDKRVPNYRASSFSNPNTNSNNNLLSLTKPNDEINDADDVVNETLNSSITGNSSEVTLGEPQLDVQKRGNIVVNDEDDVKLHKNLVTYGAVSSSDDPLNEDLLETPPIQNQNENEPVPNLTTPFLRWRSDSTSSSVLDEDYESLIDDDTVTDTDLLNMARNEHKLQPWYKRPSLPTLCVFVFMFIFSMSFSQASQLELVVTGVCHKVTHDSPSLTCDSPLVQQSSVALQKWLSVAPGLVGMLVTGKLGQLSDIYGRKRIFVFTLSCISLSHLLNCIALNPNWIHFNPSFIVLAAMIGYIGGNVSMLMALANTYIVDVVEPDQINQAMGKLMAFMYFV
ncbi:unnamed protein product [Ambrosiozyma monospora]|uniref:Unnamed protein product n=1 Tax=Ambrosiozyma monospora TaxID=43982 RepID=A0ACB5TDL3_AMBMO|nr:unnamed protein product [Ambrosiozyma monospora]